MTTRRSVASAALLITLLVGGGIFYSMSDSPHQSNFLGPAAIDQNRPSHPQGGTARVAVLTPPEMSDRSDGGDVLRQLVLPSLFVAQPDATWRAALVKPGSDRTARNATFAQFALRDGAQWSDGAPLTIEDLRRTADKRFVVAIEGPDSSGRITVRFTHPLPGWRRLWSGRDAITQPRPDVYGGPFRVLAVESGLKTSVVRNEKWWGNAFLDQIDLVLASGSPTGRALLANNAVDIYAPPADTVRTAQLKAIDGIVVSRSDQSGAWVGLRINGDHIPEPDRRAFVAQFPRKEFVGSLLAGEATLLDNLSGEAGKFVVDASSNALQTKAFATELPSQLPLVSLLKTTITRAAGRVGAKTTVNLTDEEDIRSKLADGKFDVALEQDNDGPEICWSCHFSSLGPDLAARADSGDESAIDQLDKQLQDQLLLIPLWRPAAVVGYRDNVVNGVVANGYVNGVAWNAEKWWRP